jgi:8-hydroxy-5-deazaflavin:NADPH oxidoreductase
MSSISIIGTGNMASTIGELAVAGGNTVEVIGRDQSKAADLAKALGGGATTGEFGAGWAIGNPWAADENLGDEWPSARA